MNKPNRHIDITRTNYFANLKRRAKDSEVELELLNCISLLETRIKNIEKHVNDLKVEFDRVLRAQGDAIIDISNSLSGTILPHLRAIEDIIGQGKIREVLEKMKTDAIEDEKDDEKCDEN